MTMTLRPTLLAVLLLFLLAAPSAWACPNPSQRTYTFFSGVEEWLPKEILSSERIARVRVLNTQVGDIGGRVTMVEVMEPLKNLKTGDIFFVLSAVGTCERYKGIHGGAYHYIAGEFDRGFFVGTWKWHPESQALRRID